MTSLIAKARSGLGRLWRRRRFYWAAWRKPEVPPHAASWLPDGFRVTRLAATGLTLVDNFCTPAEAEAVIDAARDRLQRSGVLINGKFRDHDGRYSFTAQLYGPYYRHRPLLPLMQRAAALTGLPYTHLEAVYVTRYPEGGLYNEHVDHGSAFEVDRLYTVLLYLNTVEPAQGGATVFPQLKVAVQPRVGRAVTWTNKNPDGTEHHENSHAAYPVTNGGEKWVIQFWFRAYPMLEAIADAEVPQRMTGEPLPADAAVPEGIHRV
ncbi:MAG: 2OG-Fe(II) oxygenase [Gammaproteobacteria bacterium]|jgi:hypothetical protein|nr:2OG-Fe(II) oxygenase [Gammaproteobacteria bacterium]